MQLVVDANILVAELLRKRGRAFIADDWHTVALALMLNADIWTQDKDFLGCGVATWITETLRLKLGVF